MRDITAVIGVYNGLDRTVRFVEDFNQRFPDIPLSISCVGSSQEVQDELKRQYGEEVITGTTERVSFSETWNAAISGVKTSKFVLIHNDMYLDDEFFDQLEGYYLDSPKKFYVYTTVEPIGNMGFVRPGKIVADFGEDLEDFKKEKFLKFAKDYKESHRLPGRGYGFYLAGFTESIGDVGGFDFLDFYPMFCEDDDLLIRIRTKGYTLYTAPAAIVYHFGSKTTRDPDARGMSPSEVEMNRNFARKWGFEARYLWSTGYEFYDEPVLVGTETIGFVPEVPVSDLEMVNIEPLVNSIAYDTPKFQEYLQNTGVTEKYVKDVSSCDIVITQVGPGNFNVFANTIGELRFKYQSLKEGQTYTAGPYRVKVNRIHRDLCRQDTRNYLWLQENNPR